METLLITLVFLIFSILPVKKEHSIQKNNWNLIWEDNFDGNTLDTAKWTLINTNPGGRASDWNRHMINDGRVCSVRKRSNPRSGSAATLADVTRWNVYGLAWYPDVLIWTLNGEETFRYPRLENSDPEQIQWPFDRPFYFIFSQQLGGSWVGEVNRDHLPVSMIIDWVKVYQE